MKYIMIREASGAEFPKFCCAPDTHRELWALHYAAKAGRSVLSAGFYTELPAGAIRTFGRSESLDLGPRPQDAAILQAWISATRTTAAMQFSEPPLALAR